MERKFPKQLISICAALYVFREKKEQPGQADCLINDFLYKQSSYCSITRSGWHLPLFRGVAVAS